MAVSQCWIPHPNPRWSLVTSTLAKTSAPQVKVDVQPLDVLHTLFIVPSTASQPGELAWVHFLYTLQTLGLRPREAGWFGMALRPGKRFLLPTMAYGAAASMSRIFIRSGRAAWRDALDAAFKEDTDGVRRHPAPCGDAYADERMAEAARNGSNDRDYNTWETVRGTGAL